MNEQRPVLHRPGCLLTMVLLLAAIGYFGWKVHAVLTTYYTHVELQRLVSPTGAWTAIIDEDTVEGPISTNILASVSLLSKAHPTVPIDLLGVDTGGDDKTRPTIEWSAPNILRVFIFRSGSLKVLARHADGVDVDIQIDPSDAAAHAAFLKQFERHPD